MIRDQKLVLGQTDNSLSCPGPSLSYLRVLVRREPELLRITGLTRMLLMGSDRSDSPVIFIQPTSMMMSFCLCLCPRCVIRVVYPVSRALRCNQLIMTTITIILVLEV